MENYVLLVLGGVFAFALVGRVILGLLMVRQEFVTIQQQNEDNGWDMTRGELLAAAMIKAKFEGSKMFGNSFRW